MRTIDGTLEYVNGAPAKYIKITFTLVDPNNKPTSSYVAETYERVYGSFIATTDENGDFSISLWENDKLVDTTSYLVQVDLDSDVPFTAALASGAGSLDWLEFKVAGNSVDPATLEILAEYIARAEAAAVNAESDAEQTALDRIATNADSAQTALDAIATAADRVQTGLDAAATAQDLIDITAIYDNFDDRYLGEKATAPTADNDGDPLQEGAIYWNTTTKNHYTWNGSAWQIWNSGVTLDTTQTITGKKTFLYPLIIYSAGDANTNPNTTTYEKGRFSYSAGMPNIPYNTLSWYIDTKFYNNTSSDRMQRATPYETEANALIYGTWERTYFSGTWSPWYRIDQQNYACTWYVDQVNGSDTNTGNTTTTAFKTLRHAISNVASGCRATIKIIGDYTWIASVDGVSANIGNKAVTITSNNTSSLSTLTFNRDATSSAFIYVSSGGQISLPAINMITLDSSSYIIWASNGGSISIGSNSYSATLQIGNNSRFVTLINSNLYYAKIAETMGTTNSVIAYCFVGEIYSEGTHSVNVKDYISGLVINGSGYKNAIANI